MSTAKKFEIEQFLGEGAFAKVFKDVWSGTPVAVKRILLLDVSDVSNNGREEAALKKLDHPNVVKLFHVESDSVYRYYYLELCNASLGQLFIKDGKPKKYTGPMPPPVDVLHQMAVGLEHIHKMELIHRDIKPENVLIWVNPENGQVLMKWADFGFSKQVNERGSHSISGAHRGTENWYAPEILKLNNEEDSGEDTTSTRPRGTVKSDVFSEGLFFGYFLLGGVHLYGSRYQIQSNIYENKPVKLPEIQPQWTRNLIGKMVKSSENRITSSEVVQQLNEIKSSGTS